MPRKKPEAALVAAQDPDQELPDIPQDRDAGALLQKDRAGPVREKYPVTEGAANFATMQARAEEAVAYANASTPKE